MGKAIAGKNSLTYRFINYNAPQEHDPTIEDRYKSSIKIDDKEYEVEILDTAGEEDSQNMMDMCVSFGEGFLLLFSINDYESFEILKGRYNRIIKGKPGVACPILLVGNQLDSINERKIQYNEAKELADSWKINYMEVSTKTNYNCKEVFEYLAAEIVKSRNINALRRRRKCIIM